MDDESQLLLMDAVIKDILKVMQDIEQKLYEMDSEEAQTIIKMLPSILINVGTVGFCVEEPPEVVSQLLEEIKVRVEIGEYHKVRRELEEGDKSLWSWGANVKKSDRTFN
ncbi:MAG: hypothetical protein LBO66_01010 [Deltaproteobacteria bacterium]|jgi:hypothetical protein|nr:hypothetical protein [Deltaproteobacteria bacterium]